MIQSSDAQGVLIKCGIHSDVIRAAGAATAMLILRSAGGTAVACRGTPD